MNRNQKIVMLVGIVVIVFMGLYPPWTLKVDRRQGMNVRYKDQTTIRVERSAGHIPIFHIERFSGYIPIFYTPDIKRILSRQNLNHDRASDTRGTPQIHKDATIFVNISQLFLQWLGVCIITALLCLVLAGQQQPKEVDRRDSFSEPEGDEVKRPLEEARDGRGAGDAVRTDNGWTIRRIAVVSAVVSGYVLLAIYIWIAGTK